MLPLWWVTSAVSVPLVPPEVVAWAAVGPRPAECRAGRVPAWRRARFPGRARYCDALARALGALSTEPARALAYLEEARAALPEGRGWVRLQARAELALGHAERAHELFEALVSEGGIIALDPPSLVDRARAAVAAAKWDHVARAYREAVPGALLLPGEAARALLVEAGAAALLRGPEGRREALLFWERARDVWGHPGNERLPVELLAMGLALGGDRGGARALIREVGGPVERAAPDAPYLERLLAKAGLADALAAVRASRDDPAAERDAWQRLASSGSPWASVAASLARWAR